ncbi:MAG: DJ-1/PfpI family protein [Blastopirellula sp. JB062]
MTRDDLKQPKTEEPTGAAMRSDVAPEFLKLRNRPALNVGWLLFPELDQIDFTGPFEVLVRVPNATMQILGTQAGPFRDHKGLILTPEMSLAEAPELDLLVVPGGPGQQQLMERPDVLDFIARHYREGRPIFSVCTGALLCGAAGVLKGRRATTHWSAFDLLPYFGAIAADERVVMDGALVTAAGVTAGIDGALIVAALLRGDAAAKRIQLEIQYAPNPPFDAGQPSTAPADVLAEVTASYAALTERRRQTAQAFAARHG